MRNKSASPVGDNWEDFRNTIYTKEEIMASNLRVALISEIISARQEKGLTQKDLESVSGVKQPVIARLEHGTTDPQLSTLLKVLAPLGKTIAIVPINGK